ncbi:hypothetical protein [Coleofasciculus sp. F4-SAH-05]|uniref:hypothetical protein n=1 Tax=Coleofasciculus TaxID=669368 RepID=UPI0032F71A1A
MGILQSFVLGYGFVILHPESVTSKVLIQTTTRELVIGSSSLKSDRIVYSTIAMTQDHPNREGLPLQRSKG